MLLFADNSVKKGVNPTNVDFKDLLRQESDLGNQKEERRQTEHSTESIIAHSDYDPPNLRETEFESRRGKLKPPMKGKTPGRFSGRIAGNI